jgi:murein L,D-transpeptidase YafK
MKKLFIFIILFIVAVLTDISMEFKDIIIPKIEKDIIEPIVSLLPKNENTNNREVIYINREDKGKIVEMVQNKMEAIDLTKVPTVIDTEIEPLLKLNSSLENIDIGNEIFIRIFKLSAELEVWIKDEDYYRLLKIYPICKQSGKLGPKLKEGDHQGVEGFYQITEKSLNPNSKYHLSINLGFPNKYDKLNKRTGSLLMIHGGCSSVGCYAIGDKYIEEIYTLVESALEMGQKSIEVHIFPFRMRDDIMIEYSDSEWYNFWGNLKEGYDYFEEARIPPQIRVLNRRYEFE